jgi:malonate transporter MadL subunit
MTIYGVSLLAACSLTGFYIGEVLGKFLGVQANVGGVGFSMLLLMATTHLLERNPKQAVQSTSGIRFWAAMYVPIVVAMSAQQDVLGALSAGPVAVMAGVTAVTISFMVIPWLSKKAEKTAEATTLLSSAANQ